jgi:hypothetical protein
MPMNTAVSVAVLQNYLALCEQCIRTNNPAFILQLRDAISADIRGLTAAQTGRGNAAKTIQRMLDGIEDGRRSMKFAHIDGKGRQCVLDGRRAFRLQSHLPLQERPADAGEPFDLDKVFPADTRDYVSVPLPTYAAVKAEINLVAADNKGRRKAERRAAIWYFGPGLPAVDAYYLLDLLTVLPDCKTIAVNPGKSNVAPLYAATADGDALILPINTAAARRGDILFPSKGQPLMDCYDVTPEQFDHYTRTLPPEILPEK